MDTEKVTVAIVGKVVRVKGKRLKRVDEADRRGPQKDPAAAIRP